MPLFNGGIRIHEEHAQRVKIGGLHHQIGLVNDQIKTDIQSAQIEIKNVKLTLKQIEVEHQLAKRSLELAKESYQLGVGKQIDILDGVYRLQLVNCNQVIQELKLQLAYLKLKKAMGTL